MMMEPLRHRTTSHTDLSDVVKHFIYATRVRHRFLAASSRTKAKSGHANGDEHDVDGPAISRLWLGLAARKNEDGVYEVGFSCHDGTYTMDFAVHLLYLHKADGSDASVPTAHAIAEYVIDIIGKYEQMHSCKFLAAGISCELIELSPRLPARLFAELDVVPISLTCHSYAADAERGGVAAAHAGVDEVADSMARKCIMHYGPTLQPSLQIGIYNDVQVDLGGRASFCFLEEYGKTVHPKTALVALKYAHALKSKHRKIAFFSATPRGGGVSLMRHALLRFFRVVGVDCTWWVPRPKPQVFRITKTNHNILQGIAAQDRHFTRDQQREIYEWVVDNAQRFWLRDGGPLAPRSRGGADCIVVDDPQMPMLIHLAKTSDPGRPVVYRSHIQLRADLAADQESNTAEVWRWLWSYVKEADAFVSHPVSAFVPGEVPMEKLFYMPATTDWLDGLNKPLPRQSLRYYLQEFNSLCRRERMPTLDYPRRDFVVQIARLDPSKGILDCLAAYAEFRRHSNFCRNEARGQSPQLVICGHGSIDDPDGSIVLAQVQEALQSQYADLQDSIIVLRLPPHDQLLNALLSCAKVALQLSTQEGFEVKVSEALHKGVPVIARDVGGLSLQVEHDRNGFLVHGLDREAEIRAVAEYLDVLFDQQDRYAAMSRRAQVSVSDEISTVGNAICWMYLIQHLIDGKEIGFNGQRGRWIWDAARAAAGEPITKDEVDLPRHLTV